MEGDPFNSFVGGTAQGLVVFLLTWLREQSNILEGLPNEMEKIKNELEMVANLPEAEAEEGNRSNFLRFWRSRLSEAAYKAEDVVDEFVYLVSRSPNVRVMGLRKAGFKAATFLEKKEIASRAYDARKKFEETNKMVQSYRGLFEVSSARASSRVHLQPKRFSFPVNYRDRPIVGMDRERRALIELLEDGESRRLVIGVKGMGGLGKTTLVCSAYSLVKHSFNCCVWLTVSPSYSIPDLVHDLFKQVMGSSPVSDAVIAQQLDEHLKNKRYLIVLDDMWDDRVWHELGSLLPNNDTGSRIIVTSRVQRVVSSLGENRRDLTLSPLSLSHALDLFLQVAFIGGICPPHIQSSAKSIVTKCSGLPLAIVTMGRLMASRVQSVEEWSSVESRLGWYLQSEKSCEVVKRILLLSFNELPYHLKRCFLYLSIFPEGSVIKKRKLIRLWIAEGLIREEQSRWTLEEQAAELCLEELLDKNLVESIDKSGKKTYKMHDVMRELALWVAMEEKFLVIHDGKSRDTCCKARRLSIQTRGKSMYLDCQGQSHVHSILNFDRRCAGDDHLLFSLKKMWSHAKFLRVLDLEGLKISTWPDGLNELFNLRYLSLRKTGIKNLPDGLEKLPNLETLDLRETELQEIPFGSVIKTVLPTQYVYSKYLQRLRHFYAGPSPPSNSGYVVSLGISPPQGICHFKNLQTLTHIKADEAFVTNVGKLIQLKKFGITNVREVDAEKLLSSLKEMVTLRHLSITAAPGHPLMLECASSSPPASIQKLILMGTMRGKLPTWIKSLERLTHLRLRSSKLIDDPLLALQVLGSLEQIELRDAYIGKRLNFPTRSFLRLKKIELWDLPNLERISIEPDAVRDIREMHFYNCKELILDYPDSEDWKNQPYKFDIFRAHTRW